MFIYNLVEILVGCVVYGYTNRNTKNRRGYPFTAFIALPGDNFVTIHNFRKDYTLWYSSIKDIENLISNTYQNVSVSPLLLAYVTLQLTVPSEIEMSEYTSLLSKHLQDALNANVFNVTAELISNCIFKNSIAGQVAKTGIYSVLDYLCTCLDGYRIYQSKGVINLLKILLETEECFELWLNGTEVGTKSIYNNSLAFFPYHYNSYSILTEALLSFKMDTDSILDSLCNLETYTEFSTVKSIQPELKSRRILTEPYKPFKNDIFVLPEGTSIMAINTFAETYLVFNYSYSYLTYLRSVIHLYLDNAHNLIRDKGIEDIILSGCKVVLALINYDYNLTKKDENLSTLLPSILFVLHTSAKRRFENLELLKCTFNIFVSSFEFSPDVTVEKLTNSQLLPKIKEDFSEENFINIPEWPQSAFANIIVRNVLCHDSLGLILLYIQLINNCLKANKYYKEVIAPGVRFLIIKVFPKIAGYFCIDNIERGNVYFELIVLVEQILEKKRSMATGLEHLLYTNVAKYILSNKLHISYLGRIFEFHNKDLELLICFDTNLTNSSTVMVIEAIKGALSAFANLLYFIHKFGKIEQYKHIENYLGYDSDQNTLKHISEYMYHSYDERIPKNTCDLLINFVNVSNLSLFQSLKLTYQEIQTLFVEPLTDSSVDNSVKEKIFNLIIACLRKQGSMVTAFFGISPMFQSPNFSMNEFLITHIKSLNEDLALLELPQYQMICKLLYEIWKSNRKHLIQDVVKIDIFWLTIGSLLYKAQSLGLEDLLLILEIIVFECSFYENINDENFNKAINLMFENQNKFVDIWFNRILTATNNYKQEHRIELLVLSLRSLDIWKKFVLIILHFYPEHYQNEWNRYNYKLQCLQTVRHSIDKCNTRVILAWAELYLTFSPPIQTENESEKNVIITTFITLIYETSCTFDLYDDNGKKLLLTLFSKLIEIYETTILSNETHFGILLDSYGRLFTVEYFNIFAKHINEQEKQKETFYYNWVLILGVLNIVLCSDVARYCANSFIKMRYLEKIATMLEKFIHNVYPVKIAEIMFTSLTHFAKSPLHEIFVSNLSKYFATLQLSSFVYPDIEILKKGKISPSLKNVWIMLPYILKINGILLKNSKRLVSSVMINFIDANCIIIMNTILSATIVADSRNMIAVLNILRFMYEVLHYVDDMSIKLRNPYKEILNSIYQVMNTAIGIMLRPKLLITNPHAELPETDSISILNRLMTVTLVCKLSGQKIKNRPFSNFTFIFFNNNNIRRFDSKIIEALSITTTKVTFNFKY